MCAREGSGRGDCAAGGAARVGVGGADAALVESGRSLPELDEFGHRGDLLMRALWIIARRELWSYLTSPVAYVVSGIFLAVIGFLFYGVAKIASERSMELLQYQGMVLAFNVVQLVFRPMFHNMGLVLVFVLPLLTMRLFAEERRQRTYDLLFSAPISVMAIVGGKFLAAVLIYTALLLLTMVLPVMLGQWTVFPWTALLSAYLGLWRVLRGANSVAAISSVTVLLIVLNALASYQQIRWDLSETQSFTLAPQTIDLLEHLNQDVTMYVFMQRGSDSERKAPGLLDAYR